MKVCTHYSEKLLNASGVNYHLLLNSTNTEALRLAELGAPEGTVVLADAQSAGRGRKGRPWHSASGKGIYFSLLLRPPDTSPAGAAPATLAAAAIAAKHLRKQTGVKIVVKWPNDLLVGNKKIGGILTEAVTDGQKLVCIVMGTGLNTNHRVEDFPEDLRGCATSLYLENGEVFERTALFLDLLKDLRSGLDLFFKEGFAPFQLLWKELSTTLGNEVRIKGQSPILHGKAVDLDIGGALLVEDDCGQRHRIFCGEIW